MAEMNNNNPNVLDDVYFIQSDLAAQTDVEVFTFHNPSTENISTPIGAGGFSSAIFADGFTWGEIAKVNYRSGESEERQVGRHIDIYPIKLSNPFVVIDTPEGGRLYLRGRHYIPASEVPPDYRVRSARSLLFVLERDPARRLCAITFRSYASDEIVQALTAHARNVFALTKREHGRAINPSFVAARLHIGEVRQVKSKNAPNSVGATVAIPALKLAREDVKSCLAPSDVARELVQLVNNEEIADYPFILVSTKEREVAQLPWRVSVRESHALPKPIDATVVSIDEI